MKLITRWIAATVLTATAAVGLSGPASAQALDGAYTLFSDQSQRTLNGAPTPYRNSSAIWNITPCGVDCARVASATGWSVDARQIEGRWEFTREAAWTCPDGRNLPNYISYSIDSVTLSGTSTGTIPVGCEGFPVFADGIAVTLTRF